MRTLCKDHPVNTLPLGDLSACGGWRRDGRSVGRHWPVGVNRDGLGVDQLAVEAVVGERHVRMPLHKTGC
jgi:hypothetical protein